MRGEQFVKVERLLAGTIKLIDEGLLKPGDRVRSIRAGAAEQGVSKNTMAEAYERAGGRIVKLAQRAFWGGVQGYFADTEGHLWEVAHNPSFPLDAEGNISLPT